MKLIAAAAAALPAGWILRHHTSPAVDRWSPPTLTGDSVGALYARHGGHGDDAIILMHGLVSSGDVFGGPYDSLAESHRLVVPDLLGFGRSLDETRDAFSAEDHLDALDELADRLGLFERRWTIGAHSMGSAVALRWACRHPERVERIVCWGAPVYPSPDAVREQISGSLMTRLFVLDTAWAERACALSCKYRTAAGWLTAAAEPSLPVPIARTVSLHTWPAYSDAMSELVIEVDWRQLLAELDNHGIGVELVYGSRDRVGDHDYARTIIGPSARLTMVPDADHHLPMSHPDRCLAHLTDDDRQS